LLGSRMHTAPANFLVQHTPPHTHATAHAEKVAGSSGTASGIGGTEAQSALGAPEAVGIEIGAIRTGPVHSAVHRRCGERERKIE
jgi:hypothetical protein